MNEKIFEEYSARIYEIDLYFYEHYKEKIKVNENGCQYILFSTGVYFTEYFLAVEIDEQEVKMTNKVLREKSNCIVFWSNKSRFLKQKHNKNKK